MKAASIRSPFSTARKQSKFVPRATVNLGDTGAVPTIKKEKFTRHFFQQINILLESHIQLNTALDIILRQSKSDEQRQQVGQILFEVNSGKSFAQALENFPDYYSVTVRALVSVGERSGKLALISGEISKYLSRRFTVRKMLVRTLSYPLVILSVALLTVLFVFFFLLPAFAGLFADLSLELPPLTRWLMRLSDFLRQYFVLFLIVSLVALLLSRFLYGVKLKLFFNKIIVRIPLLSEILKHGAIEYYSGTIGLLIENGVPLRDALIESLISTQNSIIKEQFQNLIYRLEQGDSFSTTLIGIPDFPLEYLQMIKAAEQSGELPRVLRRIAEISGEKIESQIELLGIFIEPVIIVLLSLLVGTILIALYLPIFDLSSGINF